MPLEKKAKYQMTNTSRIKQHNKADLHIEHKHIKGNTNKGITNSHFQLHFMLISKNDAEKEPINKYRPKAFLE